MATSGAIPGGYI